jgi:hypothetical protein
VPACQKNFSRYADALRAISLRPLVGRALLLFLSPSVHAWVEMEFIDDTGDEHSDRRQAEQARAESSGACSTKEFLAGPRSQLNSSAVPRFAIEPCFGDSLVNETRPLPTIIFHNGLRSSLQSKMSPRLQLPEVIYFFIRVKFQRVGFPFPPGVSKKFLHRARLKDGTHTCSVPFSPEHVIGLQKHMLHTFCQLVLEVPSTPTLNTRLQPTRLSFHPRHGSQLHLRGGSECTLAVPRLIVSVRPVLVSKAAAAGRLDHPVRPRSVSPFGTFGTADGRMGPVALPPSSWSSASERTATRAAALAAAAVGGRLRRTSRAQSASGQARGHAESGGRFRHQRIPAPAALSESVAAQLPQHQHQHQHQNLQYQPMAEAPGQDTITHTRRVMRPSFLMA